VTTGPKSTNGSWKLALGALGVVYGDIGTSPLYALKECFAHHEGDAGALDIAVNHTNVMGILSLFFWSLTLVIVAKYLTFIMRADNGGEGGILALLALVIPKKAPGKTSAIVLLGLFGAALLYGDGIITPAISVLSAVEGLEEATSTFKPYVVPITCAILIALFWIQKSGTERVGRIFGPATLVWFFTIAVMGLVWIVRVPEVLFAINPFYAFSFLGHHGRAGFFILGSVVLCITGGEALYADMGHFGRHPIRIAWYAVVFPALLLNYFGQGALLLSKGALKHTFYGMVDGWLRYPLVVVATVATVIASQALISGAYSLTQQAVQLGYWPRMAIRHTSGITEGQIYIPEINWALAVSCVVLVLQFRQSGSLAAAYGIAVTGTMSITSILFFLVARQRWGWSFPAAAALTGAFLVIDLGFFSANIIKIEEGGWVPLAMAGVVFTIMTTWKQGRAALYKAIVAQTLPMDLFLDDLAITKPVRVPGSAVFMTSNPDAAPPVLLHHYKHNKVLHEKVVCLSISTRHSPEVPPAERIEMMRDRGNGFYQVLIHYGFMQTPSMTEIFERLAEHGLLLRVDETSFYLGRETLVITHARGMARWRKMLFAFLSRNARPATAFFQIPPNRVVELGTQVEL
jgi:KUP system potassium uptake protein